MIKYRGYIRELSLIATALIFIILIFTFREDKEIRTLLVFALYFAISLIYDLDSRYPIVAAIVLLISAAIVLPNDETLANRLAIYAYYFLVVGVALQLIEYIKGQRKEEETELSDLDIGRRMVAIASGKGGVGKTTIATNLALAFAKLGRRCLLVDFDLSMPGVDIAMGINHEKSLKDVLFNNARLEECIYKVNGCDVIPSSPIPTFFKDHENVKGLKNVIDRIKEKYEIILMDYPPGSNVELLDEFGREISLILVANPDKPSLVNLYNIKVLAQERGSKIIGLVLNKTHGDEDIDNIEETLKIPVIAVLPEDDKVRESFSNGVPIIVEDDGREFSREIMDLAKFLIKLFSSKEK